MTVEREMTPEEKLKDLYRWVAELRQTMRNMENTIDNLTHELAAKADERRVGALESRLRDQEYHDHREYAPDRHTHY